MGDDCGENSRKRQKRDSSYKSKAFEKFKQIRDGTRNKYEAEEVDNVYETVDEKEYLKRVLNRQNDNWIEDDGNSGYVEDGREIFDDDLDVEAISQAKSKGHGVKRKKNVSNHVSKGTVKQMFSNLGTKKKEETQIGHDNVLDELLDEIEQSPLSSESTEIKPFIPRKQIVKSYLKKLEHQTEHIPKNKVENTIELEPSLEKTAKIPTEMKMTKEETTTSEKKTIDLDVEQEFPDDLDLTSMIEETYDDDNELIGKKDDNIKLPKNEIETATDFSQFSLKLSDDFLANINHDEFEQMDIADPFVDNGSDQEVFRFFWLDAYEDPEKHKGTVFFFGKTYCKQSKKFVSCCVAVQNITRQIFLLPRPTLLDEQGQPTDIPVTYKHLYEEFSTLISDKFNIKGFKTRLVQKKYAFDPSVPLDSDYLEVRYPASSPKIDMGSLSKQPKSFLRIFGTNTPFLDQVLIDAKLKGPCWLDIKQPLVNNNPISWCKYEIHCTSLIKLVKVDENLDPPPLTIISINFRFATNKVKNQNEILMVSCVTQTKYFFNKPPPNPLFDQHFCVILTSPKHQLPINIYEHLKNYKGTRVQKMDSEKALLNFLSAQFHKIDPDIVVGHDLQGFQIDVLAKRLAQTNSISFNKFTRLKRAQKYVTNSQFFIGRLVADIKVSAKELIKARTYDLASLCQQILKIPENPLIDLQADEVIKMYQNGPDIVRLVNCTMENSAYILKILYELNVIPLALQITTISGYIMSRTLFGGRAQRNEYLLMHAFAEKGFIVPEKRKFKSNEDNGDDGGVHVKKKASYSGGLVLEPKVGFYDKLTLLMDFNSLYPSIIQEYNVCFTTLSYPENDNETIQPRPDLPPGILPIEIKKLVDSRRQVKNLMANPELPPELKMQYHIRQMALKLTANSMYGCLGFTQSRFYAKHLAAFITSKGREILISTKELVEKMNLDVVYGDTDSIMIQTNMTELDQVYKLGQKIKQEVNKLYKTVELDMDNVFKYLLLLKKKKYAAITLNKGPDGKIKEEKELKGLDIVRRDWSELVSGVGNSILDQIFTDQSEDDRILNILNYLKKITEDLNEGRVPLQLLIITKQLTKDPRQYPNVQSLPHVQVALRCNNQGGHFRAGDTIPYVICEDGTTNSATQRAYHPDELNKHENLKIDVNYYLAQQLHPVIMRICEPIDGIDAHQIAECLGLDPKAYKTKLYGGMIKKDDDVTGQNITQPNIKFKDVENFTFKCRCCHEQNTVDGPLRVSDNCWVLAKCVNKKCTMKPVEYLFSIKNQLYRVINAYIMRCLKNKLICEDPTCKYEMAHLPKKFRGKNPTCPRCLRSWLQKEYSDKDLYYQLTYLSHIFDISQVEKRPHLDDYLFNAYENLKELAAKYVNASDYGIIDLGETFEALMGKKTTASTKASLEATIDTPQTFDFESDVEF
ncbi:hypothetical protein ABEB36_002186 [Hypothenemus hampei]|uniref:DNA polymerase n=1 Tax=Hypothenemus hampei TaxID=57062 RepID=A0ABD1F575_HYPHA